MAMKRDAITLGLCECGCGQKTTIVKGSDRTKGLVKGEPRRFISGHHRASTGPDYREEDRGYVTPCWIWLHHIDKKTGYGAARGRLGKTTAHRTYYERFKGPLPPGMEPDHLCRVRPCVNPEHLEAVTRSINMLRSPRSVAARERNIAIRASTESNRELATKYKLSINRVWGIRKGTVDVSQT